MLKMSGLAIYPDGLAALDLRYRVVDRPADGELDCVVHLSGDAGPDMQNIFTFDFAVRVMLASFKLHSWKSSSIEAANFLS